MNDYGFYPEMFGKNQNSAKPFAYPVSKVVCVGRNYVDHAKELNNPVPVSPLLFMKPSTSLTALSPKFVLPDSEQEYHYELEVAVLINKKLKSVPQNEVHHAIAGVGLALDLTLRALQTELKSQGQPWEKAKAFDGACPISEFIPIAQVNDIDDIEFSLEKNGKLVQSGNTGDMLFSISYLVATISSCFTLLPGDIILTGTPKGVGKISSLDCLRLKLNQNNWESEVCS